MVVVGVLLAPISLFVNTTCSVDPHHARKNGVDDRVGVLPFVTLPKNVIIFPKYVPSHARPIGDWRCNSCSSDQFVVRSENRICQFCGESSYYEPEAALLAASTTRLRKFNDNYAKRVTHFKNWVARLQGKERCSITKEDLQRIHCLVLTYPERLSEYDKIKLAMKELRLQRYYNHIYYVMAYCFGHALVRFSKIHEARLLAMFIRIQEPFSRIQGGRTNMLSYQFLIRKFCHLLGYGVYEYIPLLKSRSNLQMQDSIWRSICDDLGLPFYSSV